VDKNTALAKSFNLVLRFNLIVSGAQERLSYTERSAGNTAGLFSFSNSTTKYHHYMSLRYAIAASGIAIVLIYAIGSGLWVNTGDNWYANINKPSWQPPGFVFGIIWPYNFIVLGIASVVIGQRASTSTSLTYMLFFALSVAAALTWAYLFYRPHNLTGAAIALTLTALLTIPMTYILFTISIPMAIAVMPYQVWVAIAATLNWSINKLN
jgi:translocator protein